MSDMNFFSSYSKKSEKKTLEKSTVFINGFIILVIVGIIAYGTFNYFSINKLSNEVSALGAELEAGRKNSKLLEITEKEKEVKALKEDLAKLHNLDKYIEESDFINEFLLDDIRINTPSELFLKSVVMGKEAIKLEGRSKDKGSVAQFEHNLREIKGLEKVFVSRIIDENGYYSFYLDINLKEEMPDGAEAGKQ